MMIIRPASRQSGVGIIEVMVSIALGLFILAGVVQLYATTTQNAAVVSGSSTIQENARYIFSRMERDIAQAGYTGCSSYNSGKGLISLLDADFATDIEFDASQFISGKNDEPYGDRNFDSVTVRYASSDESALVTHADDGARTFTVANASDFKKSDIVFVSNCSVTGVFRVTNEPAADDFIAYEQLDEYNSADNFYGLGLLGKNDNPVPGQPMAYLYGDSGAVRYYVATSAAGQDAGGACSENTPEYCALFRELNGQPRELIEGVESFEVEYGFRSGDGTLTLKNATDMAANEWNAVDRVRVSTRLNSIDRTPISDGTSDKLTREYARTFFLFNQIPGA